jgi:uncharacterized membrane protein
MNGSRRLVFAFAVLAMSLASVAAHAEDRLEKQGRALFAKGEYEKALDIFAALFSEKSDAVYLRNIGRCYQKLQQPDKAIDSFREYLRRGHVKSGERAEVEGFIKEMEALQKERAVTAPPPPSAEPSRPTAHAAEPASSTPPPAAIPAADTTASNDAPGATLTQQATTEEPAQSTSITHRWWFWTGIAVVVAGGAVAAFVLTRPGAVVPACVPPTQCR